FLPPLEEYNVQLKRAWESEWITNRGQLVIELEEKLKTYLDIDNIIITNNGTVPLQIALKLLGKKGEIITTPFSYVATSASIVWENCKPVYVDIHPEYLTIDETKMEEAITKNTTAILATHVFGNPCNVEAIEVIAKKHNLKVIYDAAHCFGVKYKGKSLFNFGDISTCSFHATKLFHCGEGGAMFTNNKDLAHQMFYSHNFGHKGTLDFHGLGINGKISELQAAMGLAVFPYLDSIISARKKIVEIYDARLSSLKKIKLRTDTEWNYSYYPVIFNSEVELLKAEKTLKENNIIPRRYFCPSLNTINYLSGQTMPISESIAQKILCLPLYVGLSPEDVERICKIVNSSISNKSLIN
ncbi:MAG: DegT/DnrJ/EryC1/StrS family aminotransferase, partial [Bacteroidota bacterium]